MLESMQSLFRNYGKKNYEFYKLIKKINISNNVFWFVCGIIFIILLNNTINISSKMTNIISLMIIFVIGVPNILWRACKMPRYEQLKRDKFLAYNALYEVFSSVRDEQ